MFQTGREIFAKAELLSWLNRTPLCLWGLAFPSMKLAFPSSKIAFPSMKFVSLASPGAQKTPARPVFCRPGGASGGSSGRADASGFALCLKETHVSEKAERVSEKAERVSE